MRWRHLVAWLTCLLLARGAAAAPAAELWARWTAHRATAEAAIDHQTWDTLLKKYLVPAESGLSRFRYGAVSAADKDALAAYLATMQAIRIDEYARAEQRAYWINLYNAATVQVVLDHYPVKSIREIRLGGLFSAGPWRKRFLEVAGDAVSLDDIEHRILRPIWRDPRIHYAVNCASIGCPNLSSSAYSASNFDELTAASAHAYVNSSRGVRLENGKLEVSSLYVWFRDDFGGSDAAVITHLVQHATAPLAARLALKAKPDGDHYDWSLNDSP